jgi:hypothetical protein
MPFSMKLWQVQGKDLQEINHEALNDQRLETPNFNSYRTLETI